MILFLCTLSKKKRSYSDKIHYNICIFSENSILSTKYDKFPLYKMVKSDYLLSEKAAGNKS